MKRAAGLRLYGGPNPGGVMDIAIDEAILRVAHETGVPPTVRAWEGKKPVIILPQSPLTEEENIINSCRANSIDVSRGPSGRNLLLCGPGVLSFSFIAKPDFFGSDSLPECDREALSLVFSGPMSCIPEIKMCFDRGMIMVEDSIIGAWNTHYYFEYQLLQGMILVESGRSNPVSRSWSREKDHIWLDQIIPGTSAQQFLVVFREALLHQRPDAFSAGAGEQEMALSERLLRWKYATDEWVVHQSAPLALGRILLEAYLAYPPTARCRQIMTMVESVSREHPSRVEARIWLRGRGLTSWSGGTPPGLRPSGGIIQASKKNIIPAIVIHGRIVYERTVPTYEDLCLRVEEVYQSEFGGAV